jgi:hypothetical protein
MDDRTLIYKLLYQAFVDIRAAAYESKSNKAIFKIADIFHNIPLQLERVEKGQGSHKEILEDLRERSRRRECESWLDNAIRNIMQSA